MSNPDAPILRSDDGTIRPICEDSKLTFYWGTPSNSGSSAISSYTLYDEGGLGSSASVPHPANIYTITGLANLSNYSYRIIATNEDQLSSIAAAYRDVQPGLLADAPVNATATAVGDTAALVTWTIPTYGANVPPAKWFVIRSESDNPSDPVLAFSAHGTDTGRFITELNSESIYQFNVYTVNDPGYSPAASTNSTGVLITSNLRLRLESSNYTPNSNWNNLASNDSATLGTTYGAKIGQFVYFSGSNVGQYFTYPDLGQLDEWTLQFWFNPVAVTPDSTTGSNPQIIYQLESGTAPINTNLTFGWDSLNSNVGWKGRFLSNYNWQNGAPVSFTANTWSNVSIVWNNTDATMKTYVNGNLIDSSNFGDGVSSITSGCNYSIGSYSGNTMNGYLGQMLIYDRALASNEVHRNYKITSNQYQNTFPLSNILCYLSPEYYDSTTGVWTDVYNHNNFTWNSQGTKPSSGVSTVTFNGGQSALSNTTMTELYSTFTIATWFKATNTTPYAGYRGLFSEIFDNSNINMALWTKDSGGNTWYPGFFNNSGWNNGPGLDFFTDVWYHMGVTYSTETSTFSVYVNGEFVSSFVTSSTPLNSGLGYNLGGNWHTPVDSDAFMGELGEFILYNRALNSNEMYNVYLNKKDRFVQSVPYVTSDLLVYFDPLTYTSGSGVWTNSANPGTFNASMEEGSAITKTQPYSLTYDGTANMYISTALAASGLSTMTLSAWFKIGSFLDFGCIAPFITETISIDNKINYFLDFETDGTSPLIKAGWFDNPNFNTGFPIRTPDIAIGKWANFTGIIRNDGSDWYIASYLNGKFVSEQGPFGTQPVVGGGTTRIGRRWDGSILSNCFIGELGELMIYPRPLSSNEVQSNFLHNVNRYISIL